MRVGVIGCGSIGRRHVRNLIDLGCDVRVLDSDRSAVERAASECPGVSTGGGEIDAVVIATPWVQHLLHVKEALAYRLPVFVEKPLGSLDQIEDWRQIAKAAEGLVTQVGYQLRFHPFVSMLKRVFERPGPIHGDLTSRCDMRTWPGKSYGPPLLEMSHEIDLALFLGAGQLTYADLEPCGCYVGFGYGQREWGVVLAWRSPFFERAWEIEHGDASFSAHFDRPDGLGSQMYRAEMEHFLSCVQSGTPTDCPLSDGLKVLEVCQQIEALANQPA